MSKNTVIISFTMAVVFNFLVLMDRMHNYPPALKAYLWFVVLPVFIGLIVNSIYNDIKGEK